jgi:hypothetical protein
VPAAADRAPVTACPLPVTARPLPVTACPLPVTAWPRDAAGGRVTRAEQRRPLPALVPPRTLGMLAPSSSSARQPSRRAAGLALRRAAHRVAPSAEDAVPARGVAAWMGGR